MNVVSSGVICVKAGLNSSTTPNTLKTIVYKIFVSYQHSSTKDNSNEDPTLLFYRYILLQTDST